MAFYLALFCTEKVVPQIIHTNTRRLGGANLTSNCSSLFITASERLHSLPSSLNVFSVYLSLVSNLS